MVDAAGQPLTAITAEPVLVPLAPPPAGTIALAYDFGPDGATFEPAIDLTMPVPQGLSGENLSIAYWDGSTWVTLETTVDPVTGELSAKVSHFTMFSIIVNDEAVESAPTSAGPSATATEPASTSGPGPTMTETVSHQVNSDPVSAQGDSGTMETADSGITPDDDSGPAWWIIALIALAAVIIMVFVLKYGWNMMRD